MAEKTVDIEGFAFKPDRVVIAVGDSVKWVNKDKAVHTAERSAKPTFNTGPLAQGASKAIRFDEASAAEGFDYICGPHSFMKGIVVVTLSGSLPGAYSREEAIHLHSESRGDPGAKTKGHGG
jgi:plastocyanin